MKRRCSLSLFLAACALSLCAAPAAQAAAPAWRLSVTPIADFFISGGAPGVYRIELENVGKAATDPTKPIRIEDIPPPGSAASDVSLIQPSLNQNPPDFAKPPYEACSSNLLCEWPSGPRAAELPAIQPGKRLMMSVLVGIPTGLEGRLEDSVKVSGGGAPPAEAGAVNEAYADPPFAHFGLSSSLLESATSPATRAASHPFEFSFELEPATIATSTTGEIGPLHQLTQPLHDPKEIATELPPGLLVNPQAAPTCALADFFAQECESKTQVGTLWLSLFGKNRARFYFAEPVYDLQPTGLYPGELGSVVQGANPILITSGVRSGGDYGVTAVSTAAEGGLNRLRLDLWGVPADASHNSMRGKNCLFGGDVPTLGPLQRECEEKAEGGGPAGTPRTPFITMPSECSGNPLPLRARYNGWDAPGLFVEEGLTFPAVKDCSALSFEPTIEAQATTNLADSPSGLQFDLRVPQNENPDEVATPSLREAEVRLPAGLTVNPSSANGLGGCSPQQIGMTTGVGQTPAHFSETPSQCPNDSKIGKAVVHTALLHNPLEGSVYLATPRQNPFGSLLAGYIVLEGEGLIIKLPGRIEADAASGRLTARFTENPQTPFEDFHLEFFGGARGDLRTPPTCGSYETTSELTPYSHTEVTEGGETVEATPIAEPSNSFETTAGSDGGACPGSQPNAPVFRAGTESPQAGAFSPLSIRLARADGSQEISKIETTLPPGLTGKLAGVGECSDAQLAVAQSREHEGGGEEEKASPSCPASSEVGKVEVASGAGPTPLYVTGHAYLAGPYKGAPLSLAIITPALAGPFDLGDVVVRTALYVDPFTAQIKAVSDPIPHILQGIPLDLRSVTLKMDRPDFTLNPTDCEELGFSGSETSLLGNVAPLAQRFQVGGCKSLGFSPQLSLRLKGGTRRAQSPALVAKLTMPAAGVHSVRCRKHGRVRHCKVRVPRQANVAGAQVTLPHSAFLQQSHIAKTCGRPELASHTCPAASVYGHATAVTPLLDHPLEGPVYLATGFGYKLPALVADLNGQIEVLLKGKVDTGREDGLRNTFEVVPDAPVSSFTLSMLGGKKGLIVNSENLCAKHAKRKALARFTAQNGKTVELEPTVANSCGKHHRHNRHHRGQGRRHGAG